MTHSQDKEADINYPDHFRPLCPLVGPAVPRDSHTVALLRKAGAIILGKANLSEFANYKGHIVSYSFSYSAPFRLVIVLTTSGNFRPMGGAPFSLRPRVLLLWATRLTTLFFDSRSRANSKCLRGWWFRRRRGSMWVVRWERSRNERRLGGGRDRYRDGYFILTLDLSMVLILLSFTDGSIICPSNRAALYGIKPTLGLASRAGIVPISSTQDSEVFMTVIFRC